VLYLVRKRFCLLALSYSCLETATHFLSGACCAFTGEKESVISINPHMKVHTKGQAVVAPWRGVMNRHHFIRSPHPRAQPYFKATQMRCQVSARRWLCTICCTFLDNLAFCRDVRFSNRPVWVKRFQSIHQCWVDVACGINIGAGVLIISIPCDGATAFAVRKK